VADLYSITTVSPYNHNIDRACGSRQPPPARALMLHPEIAPRARQHLLLASEDSQVQCPSPSHTQIHTHTDSAPRAPQRNPLHSSTVAVRVLVVIAVHIDTTIAFARRHRLARARVPVLILCTAPQILGHIVLVHRVRGGTWHAATPPRNQYQRPQAQDDACMACRTRAWPAH
jgi:hypothetical protein